MVADAQVPPGFIGAPPCCRLLGVEDITRNSNCLDILRQLDALAELGSTTPACRQAAQSIQHQGAGLQLLMLSWFAASGPACRPWCTAHRGATGPLLCCTCGIRSPTSSSCIRAEEAHRQVKISWVCGSHRPWGCMTYRHRWLRTSLQGMPDTLAVPLMHREERQVSAGPAGPFRSHGMHATKRATGELYSASAQEALPQVQALNKAPAVHQGQCKR